jgi:carboxylesterase
MDETASERFYTRRWSYFALPALLLVTAGMMYAYYADSQVRAYELRTPRDPATGIFVGAEPRDLGPRDAPGAVLFVHGFIGTPNNYNDLPDKVAEAGWRARAMLVPGHGTFPHAFEQTSADDMIAGVRAEYEALRSEHRIVVLCGHSMGGALVALVGAEVQPDAIIFCAPFFGLNRRPLGLSVEFWARSLSPFIRWIPGGRHQPVALRENADKIVSYQWVPSRGGIAALELGRRANDDAVFSRLGMPLLLLHGMKDFLPPADAQAALDRMPSKDKTVVLLPRSDHIIFWDYDREEVIAQTLRFLQRLLPESSSSPETSPAPTFSVEHALARR